MQNIFYIKFFQRYY